MNVSTIWQPSFLDIEAPRIDPSLSNVKRLELGDGAWVDIGRRWLKGHAAVFEHLRDSTRWNKQRRQMYSTLALGQQAGSAARDPGGGLGGPRSVGPCPLPPVPCPLIQPIVLGIPASFSA